MVATSFAAGLPFTPPTSAATRPATIAAPRDDSIATTSAVSVSVRTASGLTSFRATLDGRDVTGRLRKQGSTRAGTLTGLAVGTHVLSVTAKVGKSTRTTSSRFVVGRRDRSLLTLSAPSKAGTTPVAVRLRVRGEVDRLVATLNGRSIGNRFRTGTGVIVPASLSASDGLRYGANILAVTVLRKDRRVDVEQRTIRVARTRPLVGAGTDRVGTTGDPVVFDASASKPATKGGRLGYSWRLTRRPKGSKAKLRKTTGARPVLRPDRRGRYSLSLTVTERDAGASAAGGATTATDGVSVEAQPVTPPLGLPVKMLGDDVNIAGTDFQAPSPDAPPPNFQVLVLNRQTLELVSNTSVSGDELASLGATLKKLDSTSLVFLQGNGPLNSPELQGFLNQALAAIGGEPLDAQGLQDESEGALAAIGVPGSSAGSAWVNESLTYASLQQGEISGYLPQDLNGNYGFNYGDVRLFDTNVPGSAAGANTIFVDGTSYAGTIGTAAGGFQVVALDSGSLARLDAQSFVTNTGDNASDQTSQEALATWLQTYSSNPDALVLMQAIGNPQPTTPAWGDVAKQVELLGGSRDVFNTATKGYALVGGAGIDFPADESSPAVAGPADRLTGLLTRSVHGRMQALLSDPIGGIPYTEILQVAYQAPTPWPVGDPTNGTPGQLAAGAAIAQALSPKNEDGSLQWQSLADLRNGYWDDPNEDWGGTLLNQLQALPDEAGSGYSAADFSSVQSELAKEFGFVEDVQGLFGVPGSSTGGRLQGPFSENDEAIFTNLTNISTAVENAVTPPDDTTAASVSGVLEGILSIAWAILPAHVAQGSPVLPVIVEPDAPTFEVPGGFGTAAGVLDGVLTIASVFLTDSGGDRLLENVEATAKELPDELITSLKGTQQSVSQLGRLLVSDYGKLSTAGPLAAGTSWFDADSDNDIGELLIASMRQWAWAKLLPVAYNAWILLPSDINKTLTSARAYACANGFIPLAPPFGGLSSKGTGELEFTTSISATGTPVTGAIWALGSGKSIPPGKVPSGKITDTLFNPVDLTDISDAANAGFYKPWFFSQNFATQSLSCSAASVPAVGKQQPPGTAPTPG